MVVLVVEAQLSDPGLQPVRRLRELGYRVAFVTNRLERYAHLQTYGAALRDPELVVIQADTGDSAAVARAVQASSAAPEAVFTTCDYNLPVVAELARHFGLPGLNPTAAWNCRDKLRTRRALEAAGEPHPKYANPTSVTEIAAAVDAVGLPCIVKPMTESASVDVRLCHSEAEVTAHFHHIASRQVDARGQHRPTGALVEEYLLGYEVSVECLFADGQHHALGVTDKFLSPAPMFTEIGEVFPSTLPDALKGDCIETALRGLRAAGHDFGFAHVELRVVNGIPVIVEINARLAGALIPWMLDVSLQTDTLLLSLGAALGQTLEVPGQPGKAVATHYFASDSGGLIRDISGVDIARNIQGVESVAIGASAGDILTPAFSNHETFGYMKVVAETPAEATRIRDVALAQIQIRVDSCSNHEYEIHGFDPTGGTQ